MIDRAKIKRAWDNNVLVFRANCRSIDAEFREIFNQALSKEIVGVELLCGEDLKYYESLWGNGWTPADLPVSYGRLYLLTTNDGDYYLGNIASVGPQPMTRREVYACIDSERDYQNLKWKDHYHTPEEWCVYIEDYLNEAKHILSRQPVEMCYPQAMDIMRKIGGMAVCAMEQNGTKRRELPSVTPESENGK